MSITRHAPDPLHRQACLCGAITSPEGVPKEERLVAVGESINCPNCRVVLNMVRRCVCPNGYVLVETP